MFLGSGSTLIAAEQLGRRCFGIELDPKYVDVICKRYQDFTGDLPVRDGEGPVDFNE
jgi:DNA modification methylase